MNKRERGVTIIALVVTIIIMIILASVSIISALGSNGVLNQAVDKREMAKDIRKQEKLNEILVGYFASMYVDKANGLNLYLKEAKKNGKIDNFITSTDGDTVILQKDGDFYEWKQEANDINTYTIVDYVDEVIEGILQDEVADYSGDDQVPIVVITQKTLDNVDTFTFENDQTYVVVDSNLNSDHFDFNIPAGAPVTIKIPRDMNIDNQHTANRSAINLAEGATLNLYIYGNVNVNSSLGIAAAVDDSKEKGKGGFAGIHVPEGATLNIYGNGTLKAYGGNASQGGTFSGTFTGSGSTGGSGGGGAGAGIGGNGGDGGAGIGAGGGISGAPGENCGNINIYNSVTVYAYGGAGGAGGACTYIDYNTKGNGGGGGYPAAGIGGGGAGGAGGTACCAGGGGYTGGTSFNSASNGQYANNGLAGVLSNGTLRYNGGGYFEGPYGTKMADKVYDGSNEIETFTLNKVLYGIGSFGSRFNLAHMTGYGGNGGQGGTIKVSTQATIYAYNGNRYTDGSTYSNGFTFDDGLDQCPIYLQMGYKPAQYEYKKVRSDSGYDSYGTVWLDLKANAVTDPDLQTGYTNPNVSTKSEANRKITIQIGGENNTIDMQYQGIGSGAGYREISNGTYEVTSDYNNVDY